MLISTKNIIPNFLGGSASFCKWFTSNVSTFLFLFFPASFCLPLLFIFKTLYIVWNECCFLLLLVLLTYREMWENSPGSSVLHSHSSYREAVPVYHEDAYPRFIYCTLVFYVWQISVRNYFFLYRDFPPFSSATLKLQMQKWFCRRWCSYWHHFWVVSYFLEWKEKPWVCAAHSDLLWGLTARPFLTWDWDCV